MTIIPANKHLKYHSIKDSVDNHEVKRDNFINKAIPAATKWHKSKEGRQWHSEHSKKVWKTLKNKEPRIIICQVCSKEKKTYYLGEVKFCSKACKAKDLRRRFKEEGRDYEYGRRKNHKDKVS